MPVNFGILNQLAAPRMVGSIAPSGGSGGGDGGLGDILGGFQSLIGGMGGMSGAAPNPGTALQAGIGASQGGFNPGGMGNLGSTGLVPRTSVFGGAGAMAAASNKTLGNIWGNAQKTLGLPEGNPVLNTYLQKANPNLDPTKTPWCAGYVGSVLNASGLKGTGSLAAKSYLNYGTPTDNPSQGDIVVLNRTDNPAFGHVGFVQSIDRQKGVVNVLGGNQGNRVSIQSYPLDRVAGFRQPPTADQVQQFAQQNNIKNPTQLSNLTKEVHPNSTAVVNGIVGVESGGDFGAVSKPSRNGDRAYGYSQVMGSNIPGWTKQYYGQPLTAQQYLQNPEAQRAVTEGRVNELLQQGYSPQDVASIWFSGRPLSKVSGNTKDVYGTTVNQYINKFNKGYLGAREASSPVTSMQEQGPSQMPIGPQSPFQPPEQGVPNPQQLLQLLQGQMGGQLPSPPPSQQTQQAPSQYIPWTGIEQQMVPTPDQAGQDQGGINWEILQQLNRQNQQGGPGGIRG